MLSCLGSLHFEQNSSKTTLNFAGKKIMCLHIHSTFLWLTWRHKSWLTLQNISHQDNYILLHSHHHRYLPQKVKHRSVYRKKSTDDKAYHCDTSQLEKREGERRENSNLLKCETQKTRQYITGVQNSILAAWGELKCMRKMLFYWFLKLEMFRFRWVYVRQFPGCSCPFCKQ